MFAGAKEIADLGLWGNYSAPGDNPFTEDEELQPEIWALGFRNPWRCSFDLEKPSYFLCADVGQVVTEISFCTFADIHMLSAHLLQASGIINAQVIVCIGSIRRG